MTLLDRCSRCGCNSAHRPDSCEPCAWCPACGGCCWKPNRDPVAAAVTPLILGTIPFGHHISEQVQRMRQAITALL